MTADAIDEVQRRLERRLKTRVFDTYARSSVGGFLYLVAWIPLVYFTDMHARNPLVAVLASAGFMYAAILRKLARPPSHGAEAQRRWINRYIAIALSSAVIWSMMQFWTLSSGDVPTLIKAATLFGTIAFSTVLAHLYTTLLRLSVLGIAILVVPSAVALWVDPALHVLAMATTLYAGYLVAATIRSHADYRRRLDLDAALRDQRDRYEHLSRTDSLTGLCNRRTCSETLNAQVRKAQWLSGAGVALALLDIDHFKAINDRHGHVIGDEVLRQLARRLENAFNGDDVMVARTGGEVARSFFRGGRRGRRHGHEGRRGGHVELGNGLSRALVVEVHLRPQAPSFFAARARACGRGHTTTCGKRPRHRLTA